MKTRASVPPAAREILMERLCVRTAARIRAQRLQPGSGAYKRPGAATQPYPRIDTPQNGRSAMTEHVQQPRLCADLLRR